MASIRNGKEVALAEFVQQIEIDAGIDIVWSQITRLGLQRPMLDTVLASTLQPGEPLRYTTRDGRRTFVVGRVVEVRPPTLFSHTYLLTTDDDPLTLVTWTLDELGPSRVRVRVRHSGWPEGTKRMDAHSKTWAGILAELKNEVETGDISRGTKARYLAMRAFAWALPAKTKTENVKVPE